jgi:hypothetical protein
MKISNDFTTLNGDSYYDADTKSILHYNHILDVWDDGLKTAITQHMPIIVQGGINKAKIGVIQDPAGSAIGAQYLFGAGASGAIYDTFELNPIPWIEPEQCVFNSTSYDGKRVLHTHSPTLEGSPHKHNDRMKAIISLSNAYYNTIIAFNEKSNELGNDGKLLNMVPISASIFAGRFLRKLGGGHLDPSFTFMAIAVAIGKLLLNKQQIPKMTIYFYDPQVCQRAREYFGDV